MESKEKEPSASIIRGENSDSVTSRANRDGRYLRLVFSGDTPVLRRIEFRFSSAFGRAKFYERGNEQYPLDWRELEPAISLCFLGYLRWSIGRMKGSYLFGVERDVSTYAKQLSGTIYQPKHKMHQLFYGENERNTEGDPDVTHLIFPRIKGINKSGRSKSKPVMIAIASSFLPPDCVQILWDRKSCGQFERLADTGILTLENKLRESLGLALKKKPSSRLLPTEKASEARPNNRTARYGDKLLRVEDVEKAIKQLVASKLFSAPEFCIGRTLKRSRVMHVEGTDSSRRKDLQTASVKRHRIAPNRLLKSARMTLRLIRERSTPKYFEKLAFMELARAGQCWRQYVKATYNAELALLESAKLLVSENRFEQATTLLEKQAENSIQNKDVGSAAWWLICLGIIHGDISRIQGRQPAKTRRSKGIAAFRTASRFLWQGFVLDSSAWWAAQYNLGALLELEDDRRDSGDGIQILSEAADAYRSAARVSSSKDHARACWRLGYVLLEIDHRLEINAKKLLIPPRQRVTRQVREAAAALEAGLKAASGKKFYELHLGLHTTLSRALILQLLSKEHEWPNWGGDEIKIMLKAQRLLETIYPCAKRRKDYDSCGWIQRCLQGLAHWLQELKPTNVPLRAPH